MKSGRTHLMDATPVTLGQEFGGYAAQVRYGIERINAALPRVAEVPLGGTRSDHPIFGSVVQGRSTVSTAITRRCSDADGSRPSLAENPRRVRLDGSFVDEQALGDRPVRQALGDQCEHLLLASGELRLRRDASAAHQLSDDRRVDHGFALVRRRNASMTVAMSITRSFSKYPDRSGVSCSRRNA